MNPNHKDKASKEFPPFSDGNSDYCLLQEQFKSECN